MTMETIQSELTVKYAIGYRHCCNAVDPVDIASRDTQKQEMLSGHPHPSYPRKPSVPHHHATQARGVLKASRTSSDPCQQSQGHSIVQLSQSRADACNAAQRSMARMRVKNARANHRRQRVEAYHLVNRSTVRSASWSSRFQPYSATCCHHALSVSSLVIITCPIGIKTPKRFRISVCTSLNRRVSISSIFQKHKPKHSTVQEKSHSLNSPSDGGQRREAVL